MKKQLILFAYLLLSCNSTSKNYTNSGSQTPQMDTIKHEIIKFDEITEDTFVIYQRPEIDSLISTLEDKFIEKCDSAIILLSHKEKSENVAKVLRYFRSQQSAFLNDSIAPEVSIFRTSFNHSWGGQTEMRLLQINYYYHILKRKYNFNAFILENLLVLLWHSGIFEHIVLSLLMPNI